MNLDLLKDTAKRLKQPSNDTAEIFGNNKDILAEKVLASLLKRDDLDKLIGSENREMMKDNAHNMARFMESIFVSYNPDVFIQTVLWVFRAYRSHGFQLTFWSAHLNTWIEVIKETLPKNVSHEIMPFFSWLQVNIPVFVSITDLPEKPD